MNADDSTESEQETPQQEASQSGEPSDGGEGGKRDHPPAQSSGETVFVDSSTGLRDIAVDKAQPRWLRALRYIPLVLMVFLAVAAMVIGIWYKATHPVPGVAAAAETGQSDAEEAQLSSASICAAPVTAPEHGPWDGADTSEAEAVFLQGTKGAGAWIEGRDGFRFFSDAVNSNLSQALGRVHVNEDEIRAWADYLTRLDDAAEKEGAQFLVLIAPAKWDIDPEKLPEWADALKGPTSRERLMAAHPELPWVDVREALLDERTADPDVPLYSTVNSHWSPYGASLAWNRTLDCLADLDGRYGDLPRQDVASVTNQPAPDEFVTLGADGTTAQDWAVPTFDVDLGSVDVSYPQTGSADSIPVSEGLDFAALPAETTNSSAPDHTLLVARDSMGNALSTGMMASFRHTVQVRNGFDVNEPADLAALIGVYEPDVVVLELAERYLVQVPH